MKALKLTGTINEEEVSHSSTFFNYGTLDKNIVTKSVDRNSEIKPKTTNSILTNSPVSKKIASNWERKRKTYKLTFQQNFDDTRRVSAFCVAGTKSKLLSKMNSDP